MGELLMLLGNTPYIISRMEIEKLAFQQTYYMVCMGMLPKYLQTDGFLTISTHIL